VTDNQLDRVIERLDHRLVRIREELERTTVQLADIMTALIELREARDDYRERWLQT
jgi:predicted  nucleic acid-binding Zn-ribbon protein